MTTTLAWVFGVVLTLVGVLGFVPGITTDNLLLGIFHVDMLHSIVHIVTGLAALAAAMGYFSSKLYFQVFGVVYGLVTVLGFVTGGAILFETNMADNVLHLAIAAVALYAGFMMKAEAAMAAPQSSAGMGAAM
jgi:hypothetical protein